MMVSYFVNWAVELQPSQQLVSNHNLSPSLQTDRQTDRQTDKRPSFTITGCHCLQFYKAEQSYHS